MSYTVIRKATIKSSGAVITAEYESTTNNIDLGWVADSITLDKDAGTITREHGYGGSPQQVDVPSGADVEEEFARLVWSHLCGMVRTTVAKKTLEALNAVTPLGEPHEWGYLTPKRYVRAHAWEIYKPGGLTAEELSLFRKVLGI